MNKITTLLALMLIAIPLANAIDIYNETKEDIVIRIKNNRGVTIIPETKVLAGSLKDIGDLFQEDADKVFPLHIRIWFAQDYKSPTNYKGSGALEWSPTDHQIKDELDIHAEHAQGKRAASNRLKIGYDDYRGFSYRYESSPSFEYITYRPGMHRPQRETEYSTGTLKEQEGKKEEREYSSGTILD